jgi:hypothetical protein
MSTPKNRHMSFGPNMTIDCGIGSDEPDGNPVASFPPGHVSRMATDGTLHVYRGTKSAGAADRRPSKLRDAMARMTPKSGDNQQLNVLERAAASERLADINQRNRNRYDQDNPWGRR